METQFSLLDLRNTPGMRGELLNAIKRLAQERFIQLELGTETDFEKLWSEAFFGEIRTSQQDVKAESCFPSTHGRNKVFQRRGLRLR